MKKHTNLAAERNKEPILQVLKKYIATPRQGAKCLEISSGSGQHIVHFANEFHLDILFYPSEYTLDSFGSIRAHIFESGLTNIAKPALVDVSQDYQTWDEKNVAKENEFDYMININMMHITPFKCTEGLFRNSGVLLKPLGLLFTYGPYASNGKITPDSNVRFDTMLRKENPEWGLRDIERELIPLARDSGLELVGREDMPANNKTLVWKKVEPSGFCDSS